jgi:hypothetical protein
VSDTPRTDEQINGKPCTRFEILAGDSLRNAAVPSEFARTIERELNAAQDRIKRLEEAGDALCENSNPTRWDSPADAARKLTEQSNWIKAKEAKP